MDTKILIEKDGKTYSTMLDVYVSGDIAYISTGDGYGLHVKITEVSRECCTEKAEEK